MKLHQKVGQLLESGKDISFTWCPEKSYGLVSLKKRGRFKEVKARYYEHEDLLLTLIHCEEKLERILREA